VVKIRVTVLPGHGHCVQPGMFVNMSNVWSRARLGVRIQPENMNLLHVRQKKNFGLYHNVPSGDQPLCTQVHRFSERNPADAAYLCETDVSKCV
jgi:hypothetical protein